MSTASTLRTFFACASLVLFAPAAFAQDAKVEAAAKALQKKAIQSDYLGTDFAKAKAKLEKAIADCGTDKCSPSLLAQLQRDLGTVLVGGGLDANAGVKAFAEALKLDPKIELDPDLKTSELEKAFEKAKSSGGGGGGGGGGTGESKTEDGDFVHTAAPEQAIRTPLPIYVEYSGSEALVKVLARYRAPGMGEWKTLELKKVGNGWGAEIPCLEIQPGVVKYYVQGLNSENDPVATGGDRNNPFTTDIKQSISGDAPHLPGQNPPAQCPDTGDCPPGFPGCKGSGATGSEGMLKDAELPCEADDECKSNKCEDGRCTEPESKDKSKYKKLWIGGGLTLDFVFVPGADNVCTLNKKGLYPTNDAGYYCTDSNGNDFPKRATEQEPSTENASIVPNRANSVNGGGALSKFRIMASFDYAPVNFFMIGARLGIAVPLGYPGTEAGVDAKKAAAPWLHLEARGTFIIGKDGLAATGLRGYAYGALGLASHETGIPVKVRTLESDGGTKDRDLTAWKLQGQAPFFIGVGGGVRVAFLDQARLALMLGLRGTLSFGEGVLPAVAPEVAMQYGF